MGSPGLQSPARGAQTPRMLNLSALARPAGTGPCTLSLFVQLAPVMSTYAF